MNTLKLGMIGAIALGIAACEPGAGAKQQMGTVGGAVLGGLAGSQVGSGSGRLVAVGIGTLLGAMAGGEVGRSLDRADRLYLERTTGQALEYGPSGVARSWQNPDSGHYGAVTPKPAYQTPQGQYCREYQQTITVGGKTEEGYGTACREPDGSWRIVS
jgi:surface antigen